MQISSLDPVRLSQPSAAMRRVCGGSATVAGLMCMIAALSVATAAHAFVAAAHVSPIVAGSALIGSVGETWGAFTNWVAASYARAPALVLGLGLLVAVPPLAFAGYLLRSRADEGCEDISQANTELYRSTPRTDEPEPRDGVKTGHVALRPLNAWVEILNKHDVAPEADVRYRLQRAVIRIGRESDNEVQLVDTTVHRYHAAIHRTEDAEFVITDLSSMDGNGVVVNGRAVAEARLSNGDTIELGIAKLKFTTAPAV